MFLFRTGVWQSMKLNGNPDLSIRKIDNEIFIYDRNKALVHMFNETGVFFWEAIQAGLSFEKILEKLTDIYEIDYETAKNDLQEFTEQLKKLGVTISE